MHTAFAGIDHSRIYLYQVANGYGLVKADAAHVHGYAILPAPACGAGVACLVYPLHYSAPVHFTAEVHIRRLGQETEGNAVGDIAVGHAYYIFWFKTITKTAPKL
jgi:hypothetical protein